MREARHKRTHTIRFCLYQGPNTGEFIETEEDTRGWGGLLLHSTVSASEDEKSGLECGDGYTTLEMYLTPRNGTLSDG